MKCTQPCDDELFKFIFMLSICLLFHSKRASSMLYKINDLVVSLLIYFFLSLLPLYTLMIVYKLIAEKVWIIYFDKKTILQIFSLFFVFFLHFSLYVILDSSATAYFRRYQWILSPLWVCAFFLFTQPICCCCCCLYFFSLYRYNL